MTPCPGLIPCTPTPVPPPTGMTPHEVMVLGNAAGLILAVSAVVLVAVLMLILLYLAHAATRD